jgi:tetratricopeptide (TPR) repeat protein
MSQAQLAEDLRADVSTVARWEQGVQGISPRWRPDLARSLGMSIGDLNDHLEGARSPVAVKAHGRDGLAGALRGTSLVHGSLGPVLTQAAAEAADFTRRATASGVGGASLDHIEQVVADLSAAYSRAEPAGVFPIARAYRRHVDDLLQGPHTLREARQLYVYAGWLSETLAWLSHDLGHALAADAYALDAFEHAEQAGHPELAAWAMDARASIALRRGSPGRALDAAMSGVSKAPPRHPVGVRLWAQVARAHAHLGQHGDFTAAYRKACEHYDGLPVRTPPRISGKDTAKLAAYAITSYAASSCIALGLNDQARQHAERALDEHAGIAEHDRAPSREAIARLELGAALAGLGEPDQAAEMVTAALSSPRVVDSVVDRANSVAAMLARTFPDHAAGHELRAAIDATVRERRL